MRNTIRLIAFALLACFAVPAVAQEMPQAGKLITIEVVIADVPAAAQPGDGISPAAIRELEAGGKLGSLMRIRLSGLENQPAQAQFGGDVPFVQGRSSFGGRGGPAQTSFASRSVGTIVNTNSRVEEGGSVIVQYSIQRSRVEPSRAPGEEDDAAAPPEVGVLNAQSTVRLKPGEPAIVGGRQTVNGPDGSQTWIVMTASVADAPHGAGAADARPATGRSEGLGRTRGFGSFADRAEALSRSSREFASPRRDAGEGRSSGERREQRLPVDRDSAETRAETGDSPPAESSEAPRPPAPADRGEARPARGPMQEIKVVQLENASAANVATVLQQVFSAEPVRVASDPRSNSLIITGAPRAVEVAIPLIQRLDEPRGQE